MKYHNIMGNTLGNIINQSFVSRKDDWIFYSNFADGNKLYKVMKDGSRKCKLSNEAAKLINVVDEWIYYTDIIGSTIYKINLDATDGYDLLLGTYFRDEYTKKLLEESDYNSSTMLIDSVIVSKDWIYINRPSSETFYKIKTDMSKEIVLRDRITYCINLVGETIYYIDHYDIRRICRGIDSDKYCSLDLDGDLLIEESNPIIYIVNEDSIFYTSYDSNTWNIENENTRSGYIYKCDLKGKNRVKLSDNLIKTFNIDTDWIFYVNSSDNYTLYKMKSDGTNNEKLSNKEGIQFINIVDEYIYFHSGTELYRILSNGSEERIFE